MPWNPPQTNELDYDGNPFPAFDFEAYDRLHPPPFERRRQQEYDAIEADQNTTDEQKEQQHLAHAKRDFPDEPEWKLRARIRYFGSEPEETEELEKLRQKEDDARANDSAMADIGGTIDIWREALKNGTATREQLERMDEAERQGWYSRDPENDSPELKEWRRRKKIRDAEDDDWAFVKAKRDEEALAAGLKHGTDEYQDFVWGKNSPLKESPSPGYPTWAPDDQRWSGWWDKVEPGWRGQNIFSHDPKTGLVHADLRSMPFEELIQHVANATGKSVEWDPSLKEHKVSAAFRDKPLPDALGHLFRGLNFDSSGPDKMRVFAPTVAPPIGYIPTQDEIAHYRRSRGLFGEPVPEYNDAAGEPIDISEELNKLRAPTNSP